MRINFKNKPIILSLLAILLLQVATWAQDGTGTPQTATVNNPYIWVYYVLAAILFLILILVINILIKVKALTQSEAGAKATAKGKSWWAPFTNAVPVEREADILLDHDYDGIKELDNSLPPWWKYGFYFTLVVAVIYLLRFHVFHTGPTPEAEYKKEMAVAAAQLGKNKKDDIDEKTVTMADATGIAEGKKIFEQTCKPCHGANGEGISGPNLTDDYWLHGGTINAVFHTITVGVPDKGMQAWGKTFSPTQIKDLASFVKSIKGTKPAGAMPPQGELFTEK